MNTVRKTYLLPDHLTKEMDNSIPKGKHSKFIADTVAEKLKRDNREKLIEIIDALETIQSKGEDSTEILRTIRDEN